MDIRTHMNMGLIIGALISIVALGILLVSLSMLKPPLTSQEKNLKNLERAKAGELVVCRDVTNHLDKMAVLIQHNTGAELSGRQYKKEFTGINDKIPYSEFEYCQVRVLRSKETPYSLVVGDIILGVGPRN